MNTSSLRVVISFAVCSLAASPAAAQPAENKYSYVSQETGFDSNPCTRADPCFSLDVAIANTQAGGVVTLLDAGNFANVGIDKPITIDGAGIGSIVVPPAVIVNVTSSTYPDKTVILRNLNIRGDPDVNGAFSNQNGIHFFAGGPLHVENCSIELCLHNGIDCRTAVAGSKLFVKNTVITRCGAQTDTASAAVYLRPTAALVASFENVQVEGNYQAGLRAQRYVTATVKNSVIAGNALYGVLALSSVAPAANVTLRDCVIASNNPGLQSNGAVAIIRCDDLSIVNNGPGAGIVSVNSGAFRTCGNNLVDGNGGGTAGNNFPAGSSLPEE